MKTQRMTRQKQLVYRVVQAHHDHPTADQIYLEVRGEDDRISRGTVYRNLEQLSEAGQILCVKVPGANRFDCRLDYHYHMLCKTCGTVCDAPLDYCRETDRLLFETCGFLAERHRTIFEGLCPACRAEQNIGPKPTL